MNFTARAARVKSSLAAVAQRYTTLRQGRGTCPIHSDAKGQNFAVKGERFQCWACGAGGDVIDLVSQVEKCSYKDALRILEADLGYGADVPQEQVRAAAYAQQAKADALDRKSHDWLALVAKRTEIQREISRNALDLKDDYASDDASDELGILYDELLRVETQMEEFLDA